MENIIGTDSQKADSDGDGFSDLKELQGGYDPMNVENPGRKLTEEELKSLTEKIKTADEEFYEKKFAASSPSSSPTIDSQFITPECQEKNIPNGEKCSTYMNIISLPIECRNQNITDNTKCEEYMFMLAMPKICADQGTKTQEECSKLLLSNNSSSPSPSSIPTASPVSSPSPTPLLDAYIKESCSITKNKWICNNENFKDGSSDEDGSFEEKFERECNKQKGLWRCYGYCMYQLADIVIYHLMTMERYVRILINVKAVHACLMM